MAPLNATSDWIWLTLLLAGVILGIGVFLAWTGYRPRRKGETPHCANCGYIVSGLSAGRCPECGTDLKSVGAVLLGERRVRRGRGASGLLLLVLGLVLGAAPMTPWVRRLDWYPYRPTQWVIADLGSGTGRVSDRAWGELDQRMRAGRVPAEQRREIDDAILTRLARDPEAIRSVAAGQVIDRMMELAPVRRDRLFDAAMAAIGSPVSHTVNKGKNLIDRMIRMETLSPAQHGRIAELALRHQKEGRHLAGNWLIEYLGDRELAGQLPTDQRERFYRQAFEVVNLEVRRVTMAGDPVPFRFTFTGRGPGDRVSRGKPNWWTAWRLERVLLDGRVIAGAEFPSWGTTGGLFEHESKTYGQRVLASEPGRHELELVLTLAVHHSLYRGNEITEEPRWKREARMKGTFETVPPGSAGVIKWNEDPSLEGAVRRATTIEKVEWRPSSNWLIVGLRFKNPPVNLAMEGFARTESGEHSLGTFTVTAGDQDEPETLINYRGTYPARGRTDLVLRSSEKAMKETVDMYEAWKGELVFEGLAVKDDGR